MTAARLRRSSIASLVVVLMAWLLLGCGEPERPRRAILILLDAARADRFLPGPDSSAIAPRLHQLAGEGANFLNHYSQATYTRLAIPQLFYSRYFTKPVYPGSSRVPMTVPSALFRDMDGESVSIPRAMSLAGVPTVGFSAHSYIQATSLLADEFDEFHDLSVELDYPSRLPYPPADGVVDSAIRWLEEAEGEFFMYLHLMDTHIPHFFDEDARALISPEELAEVNRDLFRTTGVPKSLAKSLEGADRAYLDALYDGSLRYADRELGRLFDVLGEMGILDETLIVVTSDHGEHLLEVPYRFDHGGPWFDAVARVPLLVRYPGAVDVEEVEHLTEAVDVLPLMLDLLRVEPPAGTVFDGRNPVAPPAPEESLAYSYFGVTDGRHKLLFDRQLGLSSLVLGREAQEARGELYDLEADPLEVRDTWAERPEVVARLTDAYRAKLARAFRRYETARSSGVPTRSFAIGAWSFDTDPVIPLAWDKDGQTTLNAQKGGGWGRTNATQNSFIVAIGDAGPLTISFGVPSGTYVLTASSRGRAEIRIPGREPFESIAEKMVVDSIGPRREIPGTHLEYGRIQVENDRFEAVVVPVTAESPFLLNFLGFAPVVDGDDGTDSEEQQEMEERLKALGYVN